MKGYCGKILKVDLTNKTCTDVYIADEIYENFLSGAGLAAWWCYRNIPAECDPMGPDNVLCITSGLLTSTGSCITGRWMVVTKSPSTGGIGEANCGGTFAPFIKACGYDIIAFHGASDTPVYLYCDNNGPVIKDASHLWGQDAAVAERMMVEENTIPGKKVPQACTIGWAGENKSWMAGVCNDNGRIAARQGVGGVMGSKMLKGLCFAGTKPVSGENPAEIRRLSKMCASRVNKAFMPPEIPTGLLNVAKFLPEMQLSPDGIMTGVLMGTWGTCGSSQFAGQTGEAPVKNWGGSQKEDFHIKALSRTDGSKTLRLQTNRYYCYSCVYGCGGELDISKIRFNDEGYSRVHKPEYETQWVFTGFLLNDDNDSMLYINEYANRAGIDTISLGGTVGMAIEAYENGLLKEEDIGFPLSWGDADSIVRLVKMIVHREGIGDILADGTKRAVEILGPEFAKYAVQGGGMEPPMHDSRPDPQQATLYAIDATPSRHTSGGSLYYGCMHLWKKVTWAPPAVLVGGKGGEWEISDEEALKVLACAYFKRIVDDVGGCYFGFLLGTGIYPIFEWTEAATGWGATPDDLMWIGKRIYTLRHMFNIKQGLDPWYSRPHPRMVGEPPLKVGKVAGKTVPIDAKIMRVWKNCGFDEKTGYPLPETVEELNLNYFLDSPIENFIKEVPCNG